jgi:hypothetical protein
MTTRDEVHESLFASVQAVSDSRQLVPSDDEMHPVGSPHLYWTETSWWAFNVPGHSIGGWIYMYFRPNLGISSQGIWIWDDTGPAPWQLPYFRQSYNLPMPVIENPLEMHAGLRWEVLEPLERHRLTFDESPHAAFELEFSARAPAHAVGVSSATGHFDQAMWVNGTLRLGDREMEVDSSGFRDRTWSVREDTFGQGRRGFYSFGVREDFSFHVFVIHDETGENHWLEKGFVFESGNLSEVTKVKRRVLSRRNGMPSRIDLAFTDDCGRSWHAVGQAASGSWMQSWPSFYNWVETVPWQIDGRVAWGEDHDTWQPEHIFRERASIADADEFAQRLGLT